MRVETNTFLSETETLETNAELSQRGSQEVRGYLSVYLFMKPPTPPPPPLPPAPAPPAGVSTHFYIGMFVSLRSAADIYIFLPRVFQHRRRRKEGGERGCRGRGRGEGHPAAIHSSARRVYVTLTDNQDGVFRTADGCSSALFGLRPHRQPCCLHSFPL